MSRYWKVFAVSILVMVIIAAVFVYWTYSRTDITPNDEFFKVAIGPSPEINADTWRLSVTGLVDNPINFTYDNITSFPDESAVVTLKCVSGPFGTAEWTGVRLNHILDQAGIQSGAKEVVFHAADGYSSSLILEEAMEDDVLVAYEMNGETLPVDHGFPVRLVVPDKYGYKWVKWIEEIEVVDYDYRGFWESRGWNDDAEITPLSQWWPHSLLLSAAAVFGAFAMVSGLKFSRHSQFWKELPLSRKSISFVTFMYFALLFPVFFIWILLFYDYRGSLFTTVHGKLALTVITLHIIGGISGFMVKKGKKKFRIVHLTSNLLGYMILLGVIITGLILIYGSGV